MADPTTVEFGFKPESEDPPLKVIPVSGLSAWDVAISDSGLVVADVESGAILDAQDIFANGATRRLLGRNTFQGTALRVRLVWKTTDGATTTPLIIRVFGSVGADPTESPFVALRNAAGELSVPIRTNPASDSIFDGFSYTTPDNEQHTFDCDGYAWFIIGVEQVYGGTSAGTAWLEVKIV